MKKTIYFACPMDNIEKNESINWRDKTIEELSSDFNVYLPFYANEEDTGSEIWGRDYYMLDHSDIILIYIEQPNNKPFLGISCEMSRAFYQHKPIIIVSSYDWVHNNKTFQYHSNKILRTLDDAIDYILKFYK